MEKSSQLLPYQIVTLPVELSRAAILPTADPHHCHCNPRRHQWGGGEEEREAVVAGEKEAVGGSGEEVARWQ
jgi:hypothetical protein